MKTCSKCKLDKPESEFSIDNQKKSGLSSWCKQCAKDKSNEYYHNHREEVRAKWKITYQENIEHKREQARGYAKKHRDKVAIRSKRWRDNNHEKTKEVQANKLSRNDPVIRKAQTALSNAVAAGKLERKYICEICGRTNCRIEGHHADYSKPLEVIWICGPCHKIVHGLVRKPLS